MSPPRRKSIENMAWLFENVRFPLNLGHGIVGSHGDLHVAVITVVMSKEDVSGVSFT